MRFIFWLTLIHRNNFPSTLLQMIEMHPSGIDLGWRVNNENGKSLFFHLIGYYKNKIAAAAAAIIIKKEQKRKKNERSAFGQHLNNILCKVELKK